MKHLKHNITVLMCSLIFTFFAAQVNGQQTEWQKYKSVDGIDIFYQETECNAEGVPPQIAIILKFVNTTNKSITIEWDLQVWYNGVQQKEHIADDEDHFSLTIQPNQSIQGNCETPFGALYIYKDFTIYKAKQKLTRFELSNIKVTLQ